MQEGNDPATSPFLAEPPQGALQPEPYEQSVQTAAAVLGCRSLHGGDTGGAQRAVLGKKPEPRGPKKRCWDQVGV